MFLQEQKRVPVKQLFMKEENSNNIAEWDPWVQWRREAVIVISRMLKKQKNMCRKELKDVLRTKVTWQKLFISLPADFVQGWDIAEQRISLHCNRQHL